MRVFGTTPCKVPHIKSVNLGNYSKNLFICLMQAHIFRQMIRLFLRSCQLEVPNIFFVGRFIIVL